MKNPVPTYIVNTDFKELDAQMFEVFLRLRKKHIPLNGSIIKKLGSKISKKIFPFFKLQMVVDRFKKRHALIFKNISGESNSADFSQVENFKSLLKDKLKQYGDENIFNCNETALYYKNPSRKSYVLSNENCKGIKAKNLRLFIMLTCSMGGGKLTPLIIGKSKCPRPLKNFDFKEVGVKYTHSPKAWMTSILFKNYLNDLDQ
ncbi:Jerky like protein-like [Dictyocoela muelleri]|nr:Jerky like protein-like [Dictyocoela muelleri]